MFSTPETYQVGVTLWRRGPEWAFALPIGNIAALEEVAALCSRFWNGANSLIIPVASDGSTWPAIKQLLHVHPVEACFLHDGVRPAAAEQLQRQLGHCVRQWTHLHDEFDRFELHPLLLQPSYTTAELAPLDVPVFPTRKLRRIALLCWGDIPTDASREYERAFALLHRDGAEAHTALLTGQTSQTSPVAQSVRLVEPYGINPPFARVLYVFGRAGFNELVDFWNLRSRAQGQGGWPLVLGVAREALDHPAALDPIRRYVEDDPLFDVEPDLGVVANKEDRQAIARVLSGLGFERHSGTQIRRGFRDGPRNRPVSFGFFHGFVGGPLKRGSVSHQQITITNAQTTFRPTRPEEFGIRTGSHIRLAIEGLPFAMPLSALAAERTLSNAFPTREGLTIETNADAGDGYLRLRLPSAWEMLEGWADERALSVQRSQAGRYGQALLERLGDLDGLDVLADDDVLAVLTSLTPLSRLKLAQRIVAEAELAGTSLREDLIAQGLGKQALFLELRARTATEIAGDARLTKARVLRALTPLIDARLVRRGASARCPQCGYGHVFLLAEQDDHVACKACRARFALPVTEPGGRQERAIVYQLDGLMARAMDQDLLPVLLTLRRLRKHAAEGTIRAAWPGIELTGANGPTEVDLVASDGDTVWLAECKMSAGGLTADQLDGLLELTSSRGAQPVFGALDGTLDEPLHARLVDRGGLVFLRDELIR